MKQEELQLTGGAGKSKRRELDFYPTPKNVTRALMKFMFNQSHFHLMTNIWEPACGDGSMSDVINEFCPVFSSDLRKTEYGVGGIDFLEYSRSGFDAIVTNPPFNLSDQFIRKATKEVPIVCMLLKSQYWHAKKRYDLFCKNPPAYILPLMWRPDFLEHERKGGKKGSPTMEVSWSVWIKGYNSTKYIPLLKPIATTK